MKFLRRQIKKRTLTITPTSYGFEIKHNKRSYLLPVPEYLQEQLAEAMDATPFETCSDITWLKPTYSKWLRKVEATFKTMFPNEALAWVKINQ